MAYTDILYEVRDRIATITLNRPDKLNAWTEQMGLDVRAAMHAAEGDDNVRVIILTGAGRGFCSGADMSLLNQAASSDVSEAQLGHARYGQLHEHARADFQRKYTYFPAIKKPIIAAINGPVVGLGFVITLYCDLRFASETARFSTTFARRGLIAEYGVSWILPRLIGSAHALDLLLSARTIDAAEAAHIGLVNRVFPSDQFLDGVRTYAKELATAVSPRSLSVIKQQIYNGLLETLEEATIFSEKAMVESLRSEDFKEGVAHFLEKRAPAFTGK